MEAADHHRFLAWAFIGSFVVLPTPSAPTTPRSRRPMAVADILSRQSKHGLSGGHSKATPASSNTLVRNHGDARLRATQILLRRGQRHLLRGMVLCHERARPSLFTGNSRRSSEGHLPVMADAERILLVETLHSPTGPALQLFGLSLMTFESISPSPVPATTACPSTAKLLLKPRGVAPSGATSQVYLLYLVEFPARPMSRGGLFFAPERGR